MYFKYACDHCGKSLKVNEEHAGRKARCPYCHNTVTVPKAPPPKEETGGGLNDAGLDEDSGFESAGAGFPGLPGAETAEKKPAEKKAVEEKSDASAKGEKPAAKTEKEAPAKEESSSESSGQSSGTDVSMLWTGLVAVGLSAIFYVLLAMLIPESEEPGPLLSFAIYVQDLFLARGWVPFVITLFMMWTIAILFAKWRKLRRQRECMLFDLLPTEYGEEIGIENLDKFQQHVRELPTDPSTSFLVNRVMRGLQHFRVRKNSAEVASMMQSQSDIDASGVDSSYVIPNAFLAVIPLLGFVGTVIGISVAVGTFSLVLGAEDTTIETMKFGLIGITEGLKTAFDTTLVGLVITIILMFPVRSMQKAEDSLLSWVDEYCNENLLKRLKDELQVAAGFGENASEIRKAINASMVDHHAELQTWNKKLENIASTVTDQIVGGWTQTHEQMQSKHADNMELINKAIAAVSAKQATSMQQIDDLAKKISDVQVEQVKQVDKVASAISERTSEMGSTARDYQKELEESVTRITERLEKMVDSFNERAEAAQKQATEATDSTMKQVTERAEITMQQVADRTQEAQGKVVDSLTDTAEAMKGSFSSIESGLNALNDVLTKLGDKQVTIEQHVHKHESSGWFGRKKKD